MNAIEGNQDIVDRLELDANELEMIEHSIVEMESDCGMDRNAAIADMRYQYIENACAAAVVKGGESPTRMRSHKIDRGADAQILRAADVLC